MCGIIGYTGEKEALPVLLSGLRALEYRGYDSSGVALAVDGGITAVKAKGRIDLLEEKLKSSPPAPSFCGIGHTRWAASKGAAASVTRAGRLTARRQTLMPIRTRPGTCRSSITA